MDHLETHLEAAIAAWDDRGWARPRVALVSGSGLAVDLGPARHGPLPLSSLLARPVEGIPGHPLEVELLMPRDEVPTIYFRGRLHAYQGYTPAEVVFPVRLAAMLGARILVMSNAAGGLREELHAGQLVLVRDHLNLTGLNPLSGDLPEGWGPRFPDMAQAYDPVLRQLMKAHAAELGIPLGEGVYAGLPGPSYETPAEVEMLRTMGADLVGMSTVLEVIAARHLSMRCVCISLVCNPAAGIATEPLHHEEVLEASAKAAQSLRSLLERLLRTPSLPL